MATATKEKKSKVVKVAKIEGRKPTLAPFVDAPFKLYATYKEKEYTAQVLKSGMVSIDDKEYTSPSSAALPIVHPRKTVNGLTFWKFNKDGKRVLLKEIFGKNTKTKKAAA